MYAPLGRQDLEYVWHDKLDQSGRATGCRLVLYCTTNSPEGVGRGEIAGAELKYEWTWASASQCDNIGVGPASC